MSKKRRIFDMDLPEDEPPAPPPETPVRRGPMATAIGENAESLRRRQEQEAAIRAENDALAHEFVRLKKLGLVTDLIPLDSISASKLVRDRSRRLDPELDDLKQSIRDLGLSNPIRVEPREDGGFELVQGWRRLSAYRALHAETGDDRYARIPAGIMARGETLESLYRRMVDENLVRKDISWAEMARLARSYADDPDTGCPDLDTAVNRLFATASPQKRSYIRRFAALMQALEKVLEHPEAIPRALGLEVAARLEVDPMAQARLARLLAAAPRRSAEKELEILRGFVAGAAPAPAISPRGNARGRPVGRGKQVLRLPLSEGEVKCTATAGRLELQTARDFSTVGRDRLEAAIAAFFAALD